MITLTGRSIRETEAAPVDRMRAPRHEHEWRVWQQAKLPAGKVLMPDVVSHVTNLVEHPQLVADRIRWTRVPTPL